MANIRIENLLPGIKEHGFNTDEAIDGDSTLNIEGAVTFQSTLNIQGAVTFQSTLDLTGAFTPTGGVAAAGGFSASPRLVHTGGLPPTAAADFTNATPVTTETYYAEVFIPANMSVTGVAVFNGSAADGDVTVGLADSTGVVVASSATTTAQSGTDAYQRIAFSSAYSAKGPATYYVLTQNSTTTARYNAHTVGNFSAGKVTSQTYGTLADITPATTFTTAVGPVATLY